MFDPPSRFCYPDHSTAAVAVSSHRAMPSPCFELRRRAGRGERALDCWLALPDAPRPGARPLVAVHGISRGVRLKATTFGARAAALGRPVIAPLFDEAGWNGYQRAVTPRRADLALLALLDELRAEGLIGAGRFDLLGFSGGAQFAHRFALLYPHLIGRLSVCAAGWWTFPDAADFPYGLGGAWGERLAAGLDRFLALDIAVSVGALDDVADPATRSTSELNAQQGCSRVARARAWTAALKTAALARGLKAERISFTILPGCGHDFAACAQSGDLIDLTLPIQH